SNPPDEFSIVYHIINYLLSYLRKPPPPPRKPPPPPQPPPPPRLPQPRELAERSPQPPPPKLDPEWFPYPLKAVARLPLSGEPQPRAALEFAHPDLSQELEAPVSPRF